MSTNILFGAGVYAKKYKALLEYLRMDFDFFTDNDSSKWGKELYGRPVISPNELVGFSDCKIIISSTHEIEIKEQLARMGLADRIVELKELYRMCELRMGQAAADVPTHKEATVMIDMYEGIGWGGSELWAANLAYGLHRKGVKATLIGGTEQYPLEDCYETLVIRFSEQETIMHMVELLEENLPCTFINNFAGCAFMAAIIVKRKYPDLLKIISVIHNDNKSLFDAHMMLQEYIDKVFCVSNQIKSHMQAIYKMSSQQYFFREQPIQIDKEFRKKWNYSSPIRIGYAARLVRQQKRADLLLDLISALEDQKVDYLLNIAGEGECVAALKTYVVANQLEKKVCFLGRLPKEKMSEFWKRQDVFVNLSEYEGTSLSMLEAMSYGCVPVTTDVSGASEFIEEKVNGFIRPVGDIIGLASCIENMSDDREKLKLYGTRCREIIEDRCNPTEYIDYWMNYILEI